MAGITAACFNADGKEKDIAKKFLQANSLRVVLHLEQPSNPSRLFPQLADPAKLKQKLKQVMKPIDAHPSVINMNSLKSSMN